MKLTTAKLMQYSLFALAGATLLTAPVVGCSLLCGWHLVSLKLKEWKRIAAEDAKTGVNVLFENTIVSVISDKRLSDIKLRVYTDHRNYLRQIENTLTAVINSFIFLIKNLPTSMVAVAIIMAYTGNPLISKSSILEIQSAIAAASDAQISLMFQRMGDMLGMIYCMWLVLVIAIKGKVIGFENIFENVVNDEIVKELKLTIPEDKAITIGHSVIKLEVDESAKQAVPPTVEIANMQTQPIEAKTISLTQIILDKRA